MKRAVKITAILFLIAAVVVTVFEHQHQEPVTGICANQPLENECVDVMKQAKKLGRELHEGMK